MTTGGERFVMRHQQQAGASGSMNPQKKIEDGGGICAVQIACRLVSQQQRWLVGHAARDRDPLPLAA